MRRARSIFICLAFGLVATTAARAQYDSQYDPPPVPLGDVARSLRKPVAPAQPSTVIDNDNLTQIMDQVENQRLTRTSMLFSFDAGAKTLQVSMTPDVTCSLSFNAQATSLISDPYVSRDLPESELAKLDGPAAIDGDSLQVSVFNGTAWRVDEITVGVTIVRRASAAGYYGSAKLVPAASETTELAQRRPDVTTLYRMRAAAAPSAVTIFKTDLTRTLGPDEEWHWAIVHARGIPPRPLSTTPQPDPSTASAPQVVPAPAVASAPAGTAQPTSQPSLPTAAPSH